MTGVGKPPYLPTHRYGKPSSLLASAGECGNCYPAPWPSVNTTVSTTELLSNGACQLSLGRNGSEHTACSPGMWDVGSKALTPPSALGMQSLQSVISKGTQHLSDSPSNCSVITTHCHAIAQQAVVGVVEVGRGGSESPQESQRDLCPLYSPEGPFDNTQGPRAAILIGKRRGCLEKWRNLCLRYHS